MGGRHALGSTGKHQVKSRHSEIPGSSDMNGRRYSCRVSGRLDATTFLSYLAAAQYAGHRPELNCARQGCKQHRESGQLDCEVHLQLQCCWNEDYLKVKIRQHSIMLLASQSLVFIYCMSDFIRTFNIIFTTIKSNPRTELDLLETSTDVNNIVIVITTIYIPSSVVSNVYGNLQCQLSEHILRVPQ